MVRPEPIEVTALDHLYVAVTDLERSEAFYDPVMRLLGFKKGTRPIAGEPHIHYYNRVMQLSLRPARGGGAHDPYRPGAVHHLCFRVADRDAVDRCHRGLEALGVVAEAPRLYEYRPDYYATFFDDPDGVRLEVVCDTGLRRTVRRRWGELEGFVDPVSRLPEARPRSGLRRGNLGAGVPDALPEELIETLVEAPGVRVERIVSRGHASPPGFWYEQDETELVLLVAGSAALELDGGERLEMVPGDWVILPAGLRHRVAETAAEGETLWLTVFV